MPAPRAHSSAKLVKLGETKPLCAFDDHQGRIRHVDANFDHCRRDEHREFIGGEAAHDRILFGTLHSTVDQAHLVIAEAQAKDARAFFGRGGVALLALLDERADPVGLPSTAMMPP